MVKYLDERLDRIFSALSDRTRRGMLARLSNEPLSVSELAAPLEMSLPAAMKHLAVLTDAGLVKRRKSGRIVSCALDAKPMQQANQWLERYERFWTESFDRLAAHLEDTWPQKPKPPSNPASPSSGASTPRRTPSTRRGRGRNT